ncbi:HAMP domain-containing protein [Sphingomonas parva]|uniref:histidine kinase n=1 Tax=Sphingomonas parva TaxID=2555898 RepID=A0A4Y8ZX65_9SPHN|nr:ATP-binding protein [Sphingomonas parva]TFI60087.1 HAMP domain-containing protein [Sphingomonas parva]
MKLFRSLSFRLAVIYGVLFTASVGVLAGVYYWSAIRGPLERVEAGLREEGDSLAALQARSGTEALAAALERRAAAPAPRLAYHALLAPGGQTVVANLPSWPSVRTGKWLRIEADVSREGNEDEYEAMVLDQVLPDGTRLLIGRDIEDLEELEEGIANTAAWLLPALVLLSIVGGMLMSRAIGKRIEAVSSAARQVIEGDLSQRVPVTGSNDDFDTLALTLNAMLDRLEASIEAIQRVSDSVAHELRTPLSRLRAELLDLEADRPEERLSRAIGETARLGAIFDSVLRISRIEARRHAEQAAPVDIGALLRDAVDLHEPATEGKALTVDTAIGSGLIVSGDRHLLFQAVSNLLDNAVKYVSAGRRISVSATTVGGDVLLTVADDGAGVPAGLRDKLAERFFRAPGGEGTPGFGLGLAFVAAVAGHHRSELRFLDNAPGLRVEWRLPRA